MPRRRLLSRSLVLSLILSLTFWRYEASEVPASYQVLYFSLKLYTVVRAVSIVPMELAILGVIPCGGIRLHFELATSGTAHFVLRAGPVIPRLLGE